MSDLKSMLLTLPDDAFFELIRNYLGPVKTPFNKHDLISQLMAFLKKDEIQDRILSLIDEDDAELLTVIWLLNEPTGEELFAFLEAERSFLQLHNELVNLEDRLLIYRDDDQIRINPELRDRLLDGVIHPSTMFHAQVVSEDPPAPWLTDTLLVSFFSYLLEEPELYKADGTLRKRSARDIAERLPELSARVSRKDEPELLRVDILVDGLSGLGLVAEENARVRPLVHAWHRWARLPTVHRVAQVAGAAATTLEGERPDTLLAAEALTQAMPAGMATDSASVARLAAAATGVPSPSAQKAIRSLEHVGVLHRLKSELVTLSLPRLLSPQSQPKKAQGKKSEKPVTTPVLIQPNFELTMPAELSFAEALFIAEVCVLVRHDTYPRFELTKERVAGAMRSGIPADHIADRLAVLADGKLPQNVAISITTWEEEFLSIRLHRGVVLQVEEPRRFAVEHSKSVKALISQELAPGLYLLDEADVPAMQQALQDAGVEMVPELPPPEPAAPVLDADSAAVAGTTDRISRVSDLVLQGMKNPAAPVQGGTGLQAELEKALKSRKLPPEQQQELAARIQRKLILWPDQLSGATLKQERTEAKGLDYSGKVRIIEQTINVGGYLEVIERMADGAPRRSLVEPGGLRKEDRELILIGSELPDHKKVELPVSKLSLVRRLRATLFRRKPAE